MKINFILPGVVLSGGVRVVFEYANRLCEKGHDVRIIYPLVPLGLGATGFRGLARRSIGFLRNLKSDTMPDWFDLSKEVEIKRVLTLSGNFIPEADVSIATLWETAEYVNNYSENKGKKFYLIQHYENWCGPEDRVDMTYKFPMQRIVVSNWLKTILKQKLGVEADHVVLNGINFDHFYTDRDGAEDEELKLLIPYRDEEWKGFQDALKAFEIIKAKCPRIRLYLFGPKPSKSKIPQEAKFYISPQKNELRKIYSNADIFLFPSRHEGSGLPPMEAMACGCAVVATKVGAVPDYSIPNRTALICTPGDYVAMAENVVRLILNPEERKSMAQAGHNHIKNFSWDKSAEKLEKILGK